MDTLLLISMLYVCASGTRFVFDNDNEFGSSLWYSSYSAIAIDQCFKPFLTETKFYKYTCASDGLSVTKEEYTDVDCTSAATPISFTPTSPCSSSAFECSGSDAYDYSMIKLYAEDSSECGNSPMGYANLPMVVDTCVCWNISAYYKTSCTSDSAGSIIDYSDNTCSTETYTTDLGTCTHMGDAGVAISYDMTNCAQGVTKPPTPASVTSAPTSGTTEPTQIPSSSPVTGPAPATKFVLDNDWILEELYPFPFDTCLQMQPQLSVFTYTPDAEYTYYECNDAGNVDKYKWTINEVPTIDNTFDCADVTTAVKTEFVYDPSLTNCDVGYFNCDGVDSYTTLSLSTQIVLGGLLDDWDCAGADVDLFTIYIATDACYCDSDSGLSGTITCDASEALEYNYTGSTCGASVASNQAGGALTCAYFKTFLMSGITLPVSGVLTKCVQSGIVEYYIPTEAPTTATPTKPPSQQPSAAPTKPPSQQPSATPTNPPSSQPSEAPTNPSSAPSILEQTVSWDSPSNASDLFSTVHIAAVFIIWCVAILND